MKRTLSPLSIEELFGLPCLSEQEDINRISRAQAKEHEPTVYLFTCADLLPAGQQFALNERGLVGRYAQGIILEETQVERTALVLLTALALSFPFPVDQSQFQALYTLALHETQPEPLNTEHISRAVTDLILVCNEKLACLDLAILQDSSAYQLGRRSSEQ
jgi:hypothetical protein